MEVRTCEVCGGALGPSADHPPCLCELSAAEPATVPAEVPEAKGGTSKEAQALRCPSCGGWLETGTRRCSFCRVELASVRCWCCFELSFAGTSHCGRCGSRLGLEGDLGPTGETCPGCGDDVLHTIDVGEHRVRECPSCAGLMVDHETLEAITHAREAEAGVRLLGGPRKTELKVEAVVYRKCPGCQKVMHRRNFGRSSGIIVDCCKEHGVFFDAHELTQILEFVASGGMAAAREKEKQEAKDELARRRLDALIEQQRAVQRGNLHAGKGDPWASAGAFITALGGWDW